MQTAQHRSATHREALADPMAGGWCADGTILCSVPADQCLGPNHHQGIAPIEQPTDDSSQRDHAAIMPQLGDGPATGSARVCALT